jgi:alcohol dehydrogenase class IV
VSVRIALPRELRIGAGTSRQLGELLAAFGLSRPLIVTDSYLVGSGVVTRVLDGLGPAVTAEVFADTVPDPTTVCVEAAAEVLRAGGFDCVVGLGGGSPMDTAKAAAILATHGGVMRDYKAPVQTDGPSLPVIAIPTTAGSGSECTRFSIITDPETNEKMLCAGLAFLPVAAVVDYELTMSMPARLSADTGVDALTHAIEAYVSARANAFSDGLALIAMRTIFANVRTVYTDPGDLEARAAMMLGATQAGMAFSNASVALVHGMSRPIGAHFHVAHGLSNAMLLPAVTEFSVGSAPGRYADCARAIGVAGDDDSAAVASDKLVRALRDLNAALDVPSPKSYGLDEAEWVRLLPLMAEQAIASGSPANNPRVPSAEEVEQLYRAVWS